MLHEKSLELNITHELLSLADGFIGAQRFFHHPRFGIPHRFRVNYATGVHINEENNAGGYDVAIHSGGAQAFYIQIKKGDHTSYSRRQDSVFGRRAVPSEHCLFKINNNTTHDQHACLQRLNQAHNGGVFYIFPFTTNERQLIRNVGMISEHGLTLSIDQIDRQATLNGVNISDGTEHKLRVSYPKSKIEIESDPKHLELIDDFNSIRDSIALFKLKKIRKIVSEDKISNSLALQLKIVSIADLVVSEALSLHLLEDAYLENKERILSEAYDVFFSPRLEYEFNSFIERNIPLRANSILELVKMDGENVKNCFIPFNTEFIEKQKELLIQGVSVDPNFIILW